MVSPFLPPSSFFIILSSIFFFIFLASYSLHFPTSNFFRFFFCSSSYLSPNLFMSPFLPFPSYFFNLHFIPRISHPTIVIPIIPPPTSRSAPSSFNFSSYSSY
jgi:hypothetical protein